MEQLSPAEADHPAPLHGEKQEDGSSRPVVSFPLEVLYINKNKNKYTEVFMRHPIWHFCEIFNYKFHEQILLHPDMLVSFTL